MIDETAPPRRGKPPSDWRVIRKDVLQRIQSGQWKPGESIPREVDLSVEYGCTRSTVGRALRDLAAAGFLDRRRKGGTTVAANPVRKAPLDVPIIAEAIRSGGAEPGYRLIAARVAPAPQGIAAALDVRAGHGLLHVAALHLSDGTPHQYESRWLVPAAVPGLTETICRAGPVDEWLLHNAPLTRATIEISAVSAPDDVAEALALPSGAATLRISRVSWRQTRAIGHLDLYHLPGFALRTAI